MRTTIEKYISRGLLAFVSLIVLLLLLPVQVVSDWHLTTDKNSYLIGNKITLTSEYNKHFDIKGQSSRALECETKTGLASYPIFYAFSGTGVGHQMAQSTITIPTIEQTLPVKCHIRIDLLYTVAGIKPVPQHATSNDFWVNPKGE